MVGEKKDRIIAALAERRGETAEDGEDADKVQEVIDAVENTEKEMTDDNIAE